MLTPRGALEIRGDAAVFPVAIAGGVGAFATAQLLWLITGLGLSLIALAATLLGLSQSALRFRRQWLAWSAVGRRPRLVAALRVVGRSGRRHVLNLVYVGHVPPYIMRREGIRQRSLEFQARVLTCR